jgi:pilus assembly protein CpaF
LNQKRATRARELLLRTQKPAEPGLPGTQIITTDQPVGDQTALLSTLKAESGIPLIKNTEVLDEALPWWLTKTIEPSLQVNMLVPAARQALNELINDQTQSADLEDAIKRAVNQVADQLSQQIRFSAKDIEEAGQELKLLLLGKGPLQPLYDDGAVTDIYMDRHNSIKCLRRGQTLDTPFKFRSPAEYESFVLTMLQSVDRVLNLSSPLVDCVLNDAWRTRVSAMHSSLLDSKEHALVLRIPRLQQISFYDLLRTKTLPATLAAWLTELVSCGQANILVMGAAGAGKTTLTSALLSAIASDERVCTIEDVPELFSPAVHLEKLVTRPANSQGEGAVSMEMLLSAALRRAPHRIIVGEIRDREGPLFLRALETGHAGSIATLHANSAYDGLWRLLDLVTAHEPAPQASIIRRISRSVQIVLVMRRVNGRPCLAEVSEVLPPDEDDFKLHALVRFEEEVDGKRKWRITARQGLWLDKLSARGMDLRTGSGLEGAR